MFATTRDNQLQARIAGALLGISTAVAMPLVGARLVARAYRGFRQPLLREQLRLLPTERLAEDLLPLCREGDDIRALVRPLLRELNTSREIAPAPAPEARGDEPSPAH